VETGENSSTHPGGLTAAQQRRNNRCSLIETKRRLGVPLTAAEAADARDGLWRWQDMGGPLAAARSVPMTTEEWKAHVARRNAEAMERIRSEQEKS
jgi:hypothetical protein